VKPISRPWTADDIARLKDLLANGASAVRCASALGRRINSVKKAARQIGLEAPGVRAVHAKSRSKLAEAEQRLPRGARRSDGSYV
jgi:hypothetical protein